MVSEVPNDWSKKPLGRLAKRVRRKVEGIPDNILMITSIGGFIAQKEKYSRFMAGESLKNYVALRRGEFAYNKGNSKTYPQGCIYRLDAWNVAAVPNVYVSFKLVGAELDSDFAVQFFGAGGLNRQLKRVITSGARGNGLLNLSVDDFFACEVPLPPLPEQKKIAAILSSVDEAIQATQAVIEQTRRVKEGLLQDLLTRGIGHTRFKQTEIGEIPESWEVRPVTSVGDVLLGRQKAPQYMTGRFFRPFLRVVNVFEDRLDLSEVGQMDFDEVHFAKYSLRFGDVLITEGDLGSPMNVGRTAVYRGEIDGCCVQKDLIRFRPNDVRDADFFHIAFGSLRVRGFIANKVTATTVCHISLNRFKTVVLPLPPKHERDQIVGYFSAMDSVIDREMSKKAELERVKAGLLQDLLTGKVRVSV